MPTLTALLRVAEGGAVLGCGVLAFGLFATGAEMAAARTYALITVLGALIATNFLNLAGSYRPAVLRRVQDSFQCMVIAWLGACSGTAIIAVITDAATEAMATWLMAWATFTTLALGLGRVVIFRMIYRWELAGRIGRTVVVYGLGTTGREVLERLMRQGRPETRICAVFDDAPALASARYFGVPYLGNLDSLIEFVRQNPVDSVVVALPMSARERLNRVLDRLCLLPIDVRLHVDNSDLGRCRLAVEVLGDTPLLKIADRPLSDTRLVLKGIEDRVLGGLILLAILPLMAAIAIAIKLDSPGPVLFRQQRYGFNDRLIKVLKFRTMYHDRRDDDAEQLTRRNDLRVTRIGRFLRRTSLDELPQFINVVCGDMSIVGPRPHACRAKAGGILYQDAVPNYSARHRVKPGITGLAQVNGWRGETQTVEQIQKRVENDLAYIENWSLWLDMKIICLTLITGFGGKHAY
jgi:Undecaprenyl-phosphate glucose phosphotransferase